LRGAQKPAVLRALIGVRFAAGVALLLFPDRVLGDLPHRRIDGAARAFARVLGVRHILEAVVLWRRPTHAWVELGAAVDGVHAATMAGLAVAKRQDRRLATANAVTAGALAAAGLAEGRRKGSAAGHP
jgi:hypothetical protein